MERARALIHIVIRRIEAIPSPSKLKPLDPAANARLLYDAPSPSPPPSPSSFVPDAPVNELYAEEALAEAELYAAEALAEAELYAAEALVEAELYAEEALAEAELYAEEALSVVGLAAAVSCLVRFVDRSHHDLLFFPVHLRDGLLGDDRLSLLVSRPAPWPRLLTLSKKLPSMSKGIGAAYVASTFSLIAALKI